MEERIEKFVQDTEISAGKYLPKIQNELGGLKDKLKILKNLTEETRQRINSSIKYFELLDEAKDWFKHGSKLLAVLARKATSVKTPEEANNLLQEISVFMKPGEELQERRIEKIRTLSTKIFGKHLLSLLNKFFQIESVSNLLLGLAQAPIVFPNSTTS